MRLKLLKSERREMEKSSVAFLRMFCTSGVQFIICSAPCLDCQRDGRRDGVGYIRTLSGMKPWLWCSAPLGASGFPSQLCHSLKCVATGQTPHLSLLWVSFLCLVCLDGKFRCESFTMCLRRILRVRSQFWLLGVNLMDGVRLVLFSPCIVPLKGAY